LGEELKNIKKTSQNIVRGLLKNKGDRTTTEYPVSELRADPRTFKMRSITCIYYTASCGFGCNVYHFVLSLSTCSGITMKLPVYKSNFLSVNSQIKEDPLKKNSLARNINIDVIK
jgi:hypothetical protein